MRSDTQFKMKLFKFWPLEYLDEINFEQHRTSFYVSHHNRTYIEFVDCQKFNSIAVKEGFLSRIGIKRFRWVGAI